MQWVQCEIHRSEVLQPTARQQLTKSQLHSVYSRTDLTTKGGPASRDLVWAWPAPIRSSGLNVSAGPAVALGLGWPAKPARVAKPAIVEPLGPAVCSRAMSAA